MKDFILPENNIKHTILVASGKGGVGKSTVAVNLSIALMRNGFKTGLLDADLFGPSVPLNLGLENTRIQFEKIGEKEIFTPVEKYGLKINSLGFMMNKSQPVIWRGPLASSGLTQILNQTRWGELDFLVIDMPPGTSDIAITMTQKCTNAGAIIVVTPQEMAVADGRKAANMFRSNGVDLPIYGVVENMHCFIPEAHPEEKYYLFGKGGGERLAAELKVPLLAQLPLVAGLTERADEGKSIFSLSNTELIKSFEKLADELGNRANIPVDFC